MGSPPNSGPQNYMPDVSGLKAEPVLSGRDAAACLGGGFPGGALWMASC